MEKCRICLKYSKELYSLYDEDNGSTFLEMITSLTNLKILNETNMPTKLCTFCRKKLINAYNFKIQIESSEMISYETAAIKRISFSNIHDIKIEYKPLIQPLESNYNSLFLFDENTVTYKDTVIKRIKDEKDEKQITVKEFLSSVKMESNDEYCDEDYDIDAEYNTSSDSDDDYGKQVKTNKKTKKKRKGHATSQTERQLVLTKPIRPILLKDAKIKHGDYKIKDDNKPKKKYKYPSKTSICPYCGKLFISKYLNIHISGHIGNRPFKCDKCLKTFVTLPLLNQHKKTHTDYREFKCDKCIATFINKPLLERHMGVHSEEKRHICNICNKAFKWKQALYRHSLVHNLAKKAYNCEICSRTCNSKQLLKHHMRVHTGERPYKCEICSQPYSYKHDFNRHCLKKHGIFLKRRSVNIMNEEVLQRERALMRDLALRAHGVIVGDDIPSVFKGPQGALAFEQAIKAVEARQIPVTYADDLICTGQLQSNLSYLKKNAV